MNIVFFGSSHFAPIVFERLLENQELTTVLAVTSGSEKGVARHPIQTLSEEHQTPIYYWNKKEDVPPLLEQLKKVRPDFLVMADFGHILPRALLDIPKHGSVNIHPSLLPKYRGTTPVQAAILNGDDETGVSLFLMDEPVDHGPLLAQARLPLPPTATAPELYETLFTLGAKMLPEALRLAYNGSLRRGRLGGTIRLETASRQPSPRSPRKSVRFFSPPQEQNHVQATYTKMLKKEDGKIDWTKSPTEVERMARAYQPWPGAWTTVAELRSAFKIYNLKSKNSEKRVKILKTHLDREGQLQIDQLQIEGKKPISWEEFARGYL